MKPVRQFAATFWVAVAMLIGLAVFFAVVGGAAGSTGFLAGIGCAAAALAAYQLLRHRDHDAIELTPDARRIRERRGF